MTDERVRPAGEPEPMMTTSEAFAAAHARLEVRGEPVTARTIVEEAERV